MRGKKGEEHFDWADPPRCRANKRRGRGTYANDRPPIVGTVGRQTGDCRLQVGLDTTAATLVSHVHQFTRPTAQVTVYTDENRSYFQIERHHLIVAHTDTWAWDADEDGIREVHTNTIEGLWTDVRNFLRRFKGVHKRFLAGYVAICEHRRNQRWITPEFIAELVTFHSFYP
jgi:transposase-like protein